MAQISEHINFSNHRINSSAQMRKMIVNLVNIKFENNNKYTCQLSSFKNSLLMSIVDTPLKEEPNVDQKLDMIKYVHIQ